MKSRPDHDAEESEPKRDWNAGQDAERGDIPLTKPHRLTPPRDATGIV